MAFLDMCWLTGHVWIYRSKYRICGCCEKMEKL